MIRLLLSALVLSALSAEPVFANGNHFGWCNGVGNPHRGSNCGGSSTVNPPSQTPSNVPVATQKPATGPGTPQTPDVLPAQVIVVTPQPGQTITGTGQVPPVIGQPGPVITGTGQPTIVVTPLPQQVLTGFSPVQTVTPTPTPSFTGVGLPSITIQPLPQQTVVGYGKVPATIVVKPIPQPSFTGTGAVPQPIPQAVPQPIPQAVPQPIPMAKPSKQPQGTPYHIPSLQPQAIPQQVPQAKPGRVPQGTPVLLPRPKPRPDVTKPVSTGGKTTHNVASTRPALSKMHITSVPGRQALHDPPQFEAADGGRSWHCVASGHGQRRTLNERRVSVSGALRHIGSIDVLGRDLPALHPQHAECIILIRRRKN
jgi:hypothetical protein